MSEASRRSFYRIATGFPPPDDDDRSASEKRQGAPPPRALPIELRRSWYEGLSCYDALESAIRQAINMRGRLGHIIVRYDIPEGSGVTWSQTTRDPHHFDLFGDREALKLFLAPDVRHEVDLSGVAEKGGDRMTFELWDVPARFFFDRFSSEDEALTFVRDLLDEHGDAYADDLELAIGDGGRLNQSGAELVERVRSRAAQPAVATHR